MKNIIRPWPALLVGVGSATACFMLAAMLLVPPPADDAVPPPAPIPGTSPDALLADTDCWFDSGWFGRSRCSWLYPARRDAAGETAALPVVVLRASRFGGPSRRATIYVTGGPGGNSYLYADGIDAWRDWVDRLGLDHDLVLYDQRGTGFAWPRLPCREIIDLDLRHFDSTLDPDARWDEYRQLLLGCADQVPVADRQTGLYSTSTAASDLRDLALALREQHGYASIGVYGVSYGSRLAVEALAEAPELVDAVVLDSLYPAGIDHAFNFADSFDAILGRIEARCGTDPACADDASLRDHLATALARVEHSPPVLLAGKTWLEQPQRVRLDPATLLALVEHALYADTDAAALPRRLAEAADGRFGEAWQALLDEWLWVMLDPEFSVLTQTLIECRDNPPPQPADEAAMLARHPHWATALRVPAASFALCEQLGVEPRPLVPRTLPQPTLLLAADLDPRTPADLARQAVAGFPRLQSLRLPIAGHSVVDYDDCAARAAGEFLNAGGARPIGDCGATAP